MLSRSRPETGEVIIWPSLLRAMRLGPDTMLQASHLTRTRPVGSVTAVIDNHTFKFGGDWQRLSPVLDSYPVEESVFFNGLAPVLAGTASRINLYSRAGRQRPVFNFVSVYGQDEWKLSPRLTFTYGLRWELASAPSGESGQEPYAVTGVDN